MATGRQPMCRLWHCAAALVMCLMYVLCWSGNTLAAEYTDGDVTYTYTVTDDNEIRITGCTTSTDTVKVPLRIDGKPVTEIANKVFNERKDIAYLELPGSIELIEPSYPGESWYFGYNCKITVKIYKDADLSQHFNWTLLRGLIYDIEVEDGVTTLPDKMFFGLFYVDEINIPDSVKNIGKEVFGNCTLLKDYHCKTAAEAKSLYKSAMDFSGTYQGFTYEYDQPGVLTVSGTGLLKGDSDATMIPWTDMAVKEVVLDDGITGLGDNVFAGCTGITSINIPYSCNSIAQNTFEEELTVCPVVNSQFGFEYATDKWGRCTGRYNNDIAFEYNGGVLTISGKGPMVESLAAKHVIWNGNADAITHVVVKTGITELGSNLFVGCDNLRNVFFPEALVELQADTFIDCPKAVISVVKGSSAAAYVRLYGLDYRYLLGSGSCGTELEWYMNDDGCLYILGDGAMKNYTNTSLAPWLVYGKLTDVEFVGHITQLGSYAFYNCTGLEEVVVPDSVKIIDGSAFNGCKALVSVTIPESVTEIGNFAFASCASLESIKLPSQLTQISYAAFYGCTNLKQINLHENIQRIYTSAFYNCSSLTKITLPAGLTHIDAAAFAECEALVIDSLPQGLVGLGANAFLGCDRITCMEIPAGVTSVGTDAFEKDVTLTYTVGTAGETYALTAGNPIDRAYISQTLMGNGLTGVLKDGVLTVSGSGYMNNFSSAARIPWARYKDVITSLVLEPGVKSVGQNAFNGFGRLEQIQLSDSVAELGMYAFADTGLKEISIPKSVSKIGYFAFDNCTQLLINCNKYTPAYEYATANDIPVKLPNTALKLDSSDGRWKYYENGRFTNTYSGCVDNAGLVWYVINGVLDSNYVGIRYDGSSFWYVINGKVQTGYTGLVNNAGTFWYVSQGRVDMNYDGVVENAGSCWYVAKGKLQTGYTGLACYDGQWYYINNGKVQTGYTGLVNSAGTFWYVSNGILDTEMNGIVESGGNKWLVTNGKYNAAYTGTYAYQGSNYTVINGKVH